jgi:drug/metabolite transporter (DMT)-like permease
VAPTARGLARQRTTLSWQRTALDFAVIGGLLLRAAGGLDNPLRLIPAGLALCTAGGVLVGVGLGVRPGGRHPGRRAVLTLGGVVIVIQLLAGVLILPL